MSMIDLDALGRTHREDPELIPDLLEIFCEQLPELQARFDRAVESADATEIRESAHIMKSRLRYLHCCQLGDLAAEIETLGRNGTTARVEEKYAALKSGIVAAVAELRASLGGIGQ